MAERAIVAAITSRRCATTADLGRALGAGVTCGSCVPELHALPAWSGAVLAA